MFFQFNEADTDSEKKFELQEKAKKIFLRAKVNFSVAYCTV